MESTKQQVESGSQRDPEPNSTRRTTVARGINESLLKSEVTFWRQLLQACDDTTPLASIERMKYALALAECRLSDLVTLRAPGKVLYLAEQD